MKNKLTSIIMTCFDKNQTMRHVSMLAAADITRYTDPSSYELIIVDTEPIYPFRDDYHVLKIDRKIEVPKNLGYYESMNIGAKEAKGKYLCFIENDVFVRENWLKNLSWYLKNDYCDAIMPDQIPTTWEGIRKYKALSFEEAFGKGATEAGLILMTKDAYETIGAWDKTWTGQSPHFGWKRIYQQIGEAGLRMGQTAKVTISHVCGMTENFHNEQK